MRPLHSSLLLVLCGASLLPRPLWAQWGSAGAAIGLDPLVVSATRSPLPLSRLDSAVTVLGPAEIAASGARDLAQLLEQVPSLDISRAGGPGGTATLRLRGMGDAQVLFLVDGVEQNDPASPGRAVDLATLSLSQVQRVEIVRGPQSALYGADAMAGVVQVITQPAAASLQAGFEVGSLGAWRGHLGLGRSLGAWTLNLQGGRQEVRGHSAARDPLGEDRDGLGSSQLRLGLELKALPRLRVLARLAAEDSRLELDNFGGLGGDDPNSTGRTQRRSASLEANWQLLGASGTGALWVQDTQRDYHNPVDAAHPAEGLEARYQGRVLHGNLQQQHGLPGAHQLLWMLEWEGEAAEAFSLSQGPWGPYEENLPRVWAISRALVVQDQWQGGPLRVGLAVRQDWQAEQDAAFTGRVTAGLGVVRASWGTGFKAPSLYQRHSIYGSADLQAERSRGWDAGVDLRQEDLRLSLGIFNTRVRQQIEFGADWHYHNISTATHQGVEVEASGHAGGLRWQAALQRQRSLDPQGRDLPRRPRTKASLGLGRGWPQLDVDLLARWEGPRQDLAFNPLTWEQERVVMGGAGLVDLRIRRRWGQLQASLAVDNLFNREFQEVLGYHRAGREWRLGLDWSR